MNSIGLPPHIFGTHSLRLDKAALIYRRTGNLRALQLLLGHTKIGSTVRYLSIEVDDALAIAEQVDVRITRAERIRSARANLAASTFRRAARAGQCLLSGNERKTFARGEYFRF